MEATVSIDSEDRQLNNLRRHAAALLPYLNDPNTLDVMVNPDGSVWVNRLGMGSKREGHMTSSSVKLLLSGIATLRGLPFSHEHPILETILPLTGDRIEGIIPPASQAPMLAIRMRQRNILSFKRWLETGGLTQEQREEIERLSAKRRNMLIVGATGSGKTTFANSIIASWKELTPADRVVIIEDTPELQCSLQDHVQLLTTRTLTQADLLVASLRIKPSRIILGEIREELPARMLLNAWNTGHSGGLATIHANDAPSALRRIEALLGDSSSLMRERIADAIHTLIFIEEDRHTKAGRRVKQICEVHGYDRDQGRYLTQSKPNV